ncbi:MAG TPA: flagellar export chaperone FliS [Candidatus Methylacidiphilales bacterium]|jgi:flagellar biosynthetic protein FliS|nr:flagellar export chaperone FliS [Candidatus Methylacidiphilales bacterium]
MDQRLRDYYIESQVNNATPGQMLVMLYDCLLEHAELAAQEINAPTAPGDNRQAAREVSRCINVLTELSTCLRHGVEPKLCSQLSDLYRFFLRQFSEALETHQADKIHEILPLIKKLRVTWAEADRLAGKGQLGSVAIAA